MALEEEDDGGGIPEWVVTFGDMMSLLLTFFIMLVSMSEIKKDEQYQAMIDSLRQHFGHDSSVLAMVPGDTPPRNANMQQLSSLGTSQRRNLDEGGTNVDAIDGDKTQVQTIRPGKNATLGGVVYFSEDAADLSAENQQALLQVIPQIIGKPQKIEIRGHASRKPVAQGESYRDQWDLAYTRCYNTMQYLIANGIDPARIRLGSAGAHEPIDNGLSVERRRRNARVEILMWDEHIGDEQVTR